MDTPTDTAAAPADTPPAVDTSPAADATATGDATPSADTPAPLADEPAPPPAPAQPTPPAQPAQPAPAARLPQDVAANPNAPPAKAPLGRRVGNSPAQNAEVAQDVSDMQAQGYRDIRVNQQQVNAAGDRVGINRPDLQGTSPTGQRVNIEYDTPSSGRGAGHQSRILANDPGATVILKIIP